MGTYSLHILILCSGLPVVINLSLIQHLPANEPFKEDWVRLEPSYPKIWIGCFSNIEGGPEPI